MDEAGAKQAEAALSERDEPVGLDTEDSGSGAKHPWRRRITWTAVLATLLAAALVLPPLINIGNYKRQITALMSRSMGRPVRLSGVELRLLPTPGFVLHDLAVSEDPRFGTEPVLSARTVVASIRVLSLWRGRIEISRVSVDEASLNLVRSGDGGWNLDSLMMGARPALAGAAKSGANPAATFPYLEATDSRVHFKNGVEKSPFSLESTDLSLWQDAPGQWRVRLRGQPMRTDIPMSLADTGEVRLEASLQSGLKAGTQLRDMPLKLDLEWRDAQLGQLSRLITGSDAGWRGDLTLDVAVQGTPDSAQTKARLRATGVRREEFAPATPMDFDANCGFRYQHSLNAAHDVSCDTAIGDGKLHLKADLPGKAGPPEAMLEVKDLPLQAGLDLLRTVRGGFAPGIEAKGAANGSLTYKEVAPAPVAKRSRRHKTAALPTAEIAGNLQGSLTVDEAEFSGGELKDAVKLPQMKLTPALVLDPKASGLAGSSGLTARFTLPLGATGSSGKTDGAAAQSALVQIGFTAQGYQAAVTGTAGIARLRELAYALGWPHLDAVDGFAGGTADFSVTAQGPWIAPEAGTLQAEGGAQADSLSGSLALHRTEWRAAYLARPVELAQGTVTVADGSADFAGEFVYGNGKNAARELVRGSVAVHTRAECLAVSGELAEECLPRVELHLGELDGTALETALLGAPEEKSLLSPLMDRMRSQDRPKWPAVALRVEADSLALGPVTLQQPAAEIRFAQDGVAVRHWEAGLLDGTAAGTGSLAWEDGKPQYGFDGSFTHLSAAPLGALVGAHWTGGAVSGSGNLQLSGRSAEDLAASAAGTVHFDWQHGAGLARAGLAGAGLAAAESAFDDWSGTAAIQDGKVVLGENTLRARRKSSSLVGSIPFSGPVELTVAPVGGRQVAGSTPKPAVK